MAVLQQSALLPGQQEIGFYREHGWWVSPPCIDEDTIDELSYAVERYYAGERDFLLPFQPGTDWTPAQAEALRQNDYLSLQMAEFHRFVREPLLPAMAALLCETSSIRLFHDQLLYKAPARNPQSTIVGWHADRAYWRTCTSDSMLTAWVPLQDCTEEMGPMVVLDGSHKLVGNEQLHTFNQTDLAALETRIAGGGVPLKFVPFTLKKGQVSFHHCLTIHGSYPNRSNRPRAALAIHYQDEANRYRLFRDPEGNVVAHLNDALCRADGEAHPDYGDPEICPTLWPSLSEPRT